jgi:hypothetical protein
MFVNFTIVYMRLKFIRRVCEITSFVSVCPFAWNNLAANGRSFMTFCVRGFLEDLHRNSSFFKTDNSNGHTT